MREENGPLIATILAGMRNGLTLGNHYREGMEGREKHRVDQ